MGDGNRVSSLVEALARKNRVEEPTVVRVGLEVRTSIGFTLKPEDQARQILSDRPGLDAFRVVWEYRVAKGDLGDFHVGLSNETSLLSGTKNGPVRYLGTYVVKEQPGDEPLFVTSWGCPDADTALTVAKGPWSGPAGLEKLFRETFEGFFDHATAERITSHGLAAASSV